ncbi:MAG: signal recognition particle protein [Vicinamibacteria bacterium]
MFEQVSEKLQGVFKKLRGQSRLKEEHVDEAMREIRLALLEADVQFHVAKDFTGRVRAKAIGKEILSSLTAAQQVIQVTRDELVALLGGSERGLDLSKGWPSVVLMAGLQGSGKTTSSAKLSRLLREQGRHPALVSVDVKRPAALEQLAVLASELQIPYLSPESMDAVERAGQSLAMAKDRGFDVLIIDSAGRVHVDEEQMSELQAIEKRTSPAETLFVADSMTGQDAVASASTFGSKVPLTGHVLTKLDGDARGGAALSITAVTGVPIKFVGTGEKLEAFEPFRPDRMASRILGMGDVLSLIERAEKTFEQEQAKELARKMERDELTLEDFRQQLRQMKRMGSLSEILSFLPGASALPAEVDEGELKRFEAILDSMTVHERTHPAVVNGSRRKRIARGSGTAVSDVNRLLRRFSEARRMVKKLSLIQKSAGGSSKKLARMLGRR